MATACKTTPAAPAAPADRAPRWTPGPDRRRKRGQVPAHHTEWAGPGPRRRPPALLGNRQCRTQTGLERVDSPASLPTCSETSLTSPLELNCHGHLTLTLTFDIDYILVVGQFGLATGSG